MKIGDVRIYKVSKNAKEDYRRNVKGNEHTEDDQIRLKLARNIYLATEEKLSAFKKVYKYGSLHITTYFDWVINIKNYQPVPKEWRFNKKAYFRVTSLLEIKDNKFESKKFVKSYLNKG